MSLLLTLNRYLDKRTITYVYGKNSNKAAAGRFLFKFDCNNNNLSANTSKITKSDSKMTSKTSLRWLLTLKKSGHFRAKLDFYTILKKTAFLMFPGGMERKHCPENGSNYFITTSKISKNVFITRSCKTKYMLTNLRIKTTGITKAAIKVILLKRLLFLQILQKSQENTCARVSEKTDPDRGVYLRIWQYI